MKDTNMGKSESKQYIPVSGTEQTPEATQIPQDDTFQDGTDPSETANRKAFEAHKHKGRFQNMTHLGRYAIYRDGKYVMVTPFPEHVIAMNERVFANGVVEYFDTEDE